MVENFSVDTSVCRFLDEPKFQSMKDVKRASDNFRSGIDFINAEETIDSYRAFRACCIETSLKILQGMHLPKNGLVSARLKRMRSIRRKLIRRSTFHVHQLNDIVGFRIIFQSLSELRDVANMLSLAGDKTDDYLAKPKCTGYRGIHVIFSFKQPFSEKSCVKVRFEVQLRTHYQHLWACWCESMGEQAKEGWKNRKDDPEIQEKIARLKSLSEEIRVWENNNPETLQTQKKLPLIGNLSKQIAVVRGGLDSGGYIDLDECDDTTEAFNLLQDYEDQQNLRALLLLGLSEPDITSHFSQTHMNWFKEVPEPEYWWPPKTPD